MTNMTDADGTNLTDVPSNETAANMTTNMTDPDGINMTDLMSKFVPPKL
jgi:hypothetical protein